MKILDKLEKLPVGEIVTNKQILSVLKRAGLIYDYSPWGYLESQYVYYMDEWDGKVTREHDFTYSGPILKPGMVGSLDNPYPSHSKALEAKYGCWLNINYKGYTFSSKYLDGCFNAYLELTGKPSGEKRTVNRRMSVFGAIV